VKPLEDNDIFEKLQSLDFSRFSLKHKEQLWQALNQRNNRRVLSEQELDFSAAGVANGRSGAAVTCWFQNDGIDTKGRGWKCGNRSRCAYFKDKCRCFGTDNCQSGIHIINCPCG